MCVIKEVPCIIVEEDESYTISLNNVPKEIIEFISTAGKVKLTQGSDKSSLNLVFERKDD